MRKFGRLLTSGSAFALAAVSTPIAYAQDISPPDGGETPASADSETEGQKNLDVVLVTAERREESVQSIPIAISAFSGDDVLDAGATGVDGLKQVSSSLQFGKGPIDNFVTIRGVGAELINVTAEAGVSIAQDGVPFTSQTMFDAAFMDVGRVEVLRGPQGTIAGRNATGGTINIHSASPTEEFEGRIRATLGNFNRREFEGVLSGPLAGDTLLGRIAVRTERADGWAENTLTGEDFNNAENFKIRGTLLANITDDLTASLILEHFVDQASPMIFALGRARPDQPSYAEIVGIPLYDVDERTFQANYPSNRDVEGSKGILRLSWDIGATTNLTSITGYIANKNTGQFGGGLIDSPAVFDYLETDVEQLSQELTLTADITDRLDVIVGGLYLNTESEEPLLFGVPPSGIPVDTFDFTANQELTSYALYSQLRYQLTDSWRVTVGGRYTRDEKDYSETDFFAGVPLPGVAPVTESWEAFTPRVAIDYAPSQDLLVYASVSRGFKAGGINAFATSDGSFDQYEPEFIWNYEAGVKASLLDDQLKGTLTGFYMEYSDVQQNLRILNETTGVALPNVVNASSATIKGVEASLDAAVTDQLTLRAAGTWLDATYDQLQTTDLIYPELGERDLSGNRLSRAPEWQYNISGEYTVPLNGTLQAALRADYQWQSQQYFSFFNHELNAQDAYGVLNVLASVGPGDSAWRLSAFARNLMDEDYITYAEANVSLGNPSLGGAVGVPRTYGISLEINF